MTGGNADKNILPPPDARLINPKKEKLPIPYDDRGLIIIDSLISIVMGSIDSDYEWRGKPDGHHFWHPHSLYEKLDEGRRNSRMKEFHNLPIYVGLMPRDFHNWLHLVTGRPKQPKRWVAEGVIDSYHLAHDLFTHARNFTMLKGLDLAPHYVETHVDSDTQQSLEATTQTGREFMHEPLRRHFDRYLRTLEAITRLNPEDQPILIDDELWEENGLIEVPQRLARYAGKRALDLTGYFSSHWAA